MKQIILLITAFVANAGFVAQAQIRFVGYEKDLAVFQIRKDGTILQLTALNDSDGTNRPLNVTDMSEVQDILHYANGQFVAISLYEELVVHSAANQQQVRFQEGLSEEGDFTERTVGYYNRMQLSNIHLTSEGNRLLYPKANTLAIISYDLSGNQKTSMDLSSLDDYGGQIISPRDTKTALIFLASLKGPYELYRQHKASQEIKKAPITMGRRENFGLAHHPNGNEVLMIYEDLLLAYRFDLNRFQQLKIPDGVSIEKKGLQKFFQKIYYSRQTKEWRYAAAGNDGISSMSIGAEEQNSAFSLDINAVEKLVAAEKLRNQSAMDELRNTFKRLSRVPKPFDRQMKQEINETLVKFDNKYSQKATSDTQTMQAVTMSRLMRLDTAMVPATVVTGTQERLTAMIQADQLN
ncbi:MAG: hypothetical protein AAFO69_13975, partial [Bacteroidota bacterium]